MTENESKKYMLIEKECINRDCNRDCANCDIVQDVEDLNNAYDVAINALEKQIPKKPIEIDTYGEYYKCPICNKYAVDNFGCNYKFCRECGQKLDWSDGE